ncbi:MAG: MBL fold metallo-hydrolase [Shimia sp.]
MRIFALALALLLAAPVSAQDTRNSHCIALAEVPGIEFVHKASWAEPVDDFSVRIRYVDHAMFLIQSAGGASAATDYNGFLGVVDFTPDIVTMNNSHETHWTSIPDPAIPHVLPGWGDADGPARHNLVVGDMRVRNVTTDTRGWDGVAVRPDTNSIFVFEVEGLCIGHLGHLHHALDDAHYAALGRLDVVMAPVDGGFTLPRAELVEILRRLRSSVVIPMHWFGRANLEAFLTEMEGDFAIERLDTPETVVSLRTLPSRPTIRVLRPQFLRDGE